MKCLYLVTGSLDPKGTGQTRWVTQSKPALNAFAITFAEVLGIRVDSRREGRRTRPFRSTEGVTSPSWFARGAVKISRRPSQSVPQKLGFLSRGRFRHAVRVSARSGSGRLSA
jgi:hypothetical protein